MELSVTLREPRKRGELFGPGDRNLRRIRETLGVRLQARNSLVRLSGDPASVAKAAAVIEQLQDLLGARAYLDDEAVEEVIAEVEQSEATTDLEAIRVFSREPVVPKTEGQRHYLRAMLENDLVFCLGPAGTGKTYLAVAIAVNLLKTGKTRRIVLVRPAVEAGEKLGFLPGDLQQKVNPYLRPLFDAMHDMMTFDQLKRFMVNDIIEVIPLAYMRGRTLNHAVIILDEAQNTTPLQMLMFLTRLGHHSKMIVTGDDSQIDLTPGQPSGLIDAGRRLRDCAGVRILRLEKDDIVRHRLVQEIVHRYADRVVGSPAQGIASDNQHDRPGATCEDVPADPPEVNRPSPEAER
jgi:phosphate starvation-inducible PhoH-like protein